MRVFQNTSIRHKQVLIIMLITSVALLLACATFVSFETFNFRKEMVKNLSTLAKIIGNNTSAALDFNDPKSAEETLFALQAQPNIVSACVFSRSGQIFANYDRPGDAITFTPPPKPQPAGYSFGKNSLTVFEPITSKGDVIGVIYLESDMQALHSKLTQFAVITVAVFLLTLLVAFLLSARLQRLISEPILDLVRTACAVAQDRDYSIRVIKRSTDEIGVLIDGFNEMLAQIQQRDAALQSARDGLEVRVAERTAELAKTNEALLTENTERKKADEALRLLGSAVEQSKESILITDAQLELPGPKIIFVNPAFTKITGYTAEEAIGKTPRILQGPHSDKIVLSRLRQNLQRGEAFEGETINYRKDGTEFNIEWQVAPIRNASGKITHFVAIQHDITARKRFEAQLFQSQRMETVGKLAGGIAHEFNSILTAIIGQNELLLGDLPAGSPLAKNAIEISRAAGRAAMLTRQLLAYGRKQILQPEILDLNQVIASMEGMFHHLTGEEVETQIVPAPDLHAVKADAGQIEQVIMNMVMNARDAMPNGGKLTMETANITFDQESVGRYPELKAGEYVMLAITDTGAGMSEEVRARVFEPFFTTKGVGQGTGLGLSTCYGIIKQSGGHISVYSERGRGATFKIYLPQFERHAILSVPRIDSQNLPHGTETILLVEDDPALREMAGTLLRRLGYTVFAAANGIEALSLKQQRDIGHIDLLFTDVVMPHMSGKELADRVRALFPHTRILFTSAYTENAIVHQGVLNKGVALLQKPFTPSALAHKLREVLDQPHPPESDTAQKTFGFTKVSTEAIRRD
jgi:PAS domain S-box-containing protein